MQSLIICRLTALQVEVTECLRAEKPFDGKKIDTMRGGRE